MARKGGSSGGPRGLAPKAACQALPAHWRTHFSHLQVAAQEQLVPHSHLRGREAGTQAAGRQRAGAQRGSAAGAGRPQRKAPRAARLYAGQQARCLHVLASAGARHSCLLLGVSGVVTCARGTQYLVTRVSPQRARPHPLRLQAQTAQCSLSTCALKGERPQAYSSYSTGKNSETLLPATVCVHALGRALQGPEMPLHGRPAPEVKPSGAAPFARCSPGGRGEGGQRSF